MSERLSSETYTALGLTRVAAGHLREKGFDDARLEAELLMAGVLGIDRLQVYLQHDRPLTPDEVGLFRDAVRRRLRHEPVQYIVGTVGFREIELKVDRRALIPRPETEVLVGVVLSEVGGEAGVEGGEDAEGALAGGDEAALARARGLAGGDEAAPARARALARALARARGGGRGGGRAMKVAELGTGTGAIALSLLVEGEFAEAVATDTSAGALELAAENAQRLGLAGRLELRQGSLFQPFEKGERFDVIVSNPPYIAESERAQLAPEVVDWEPAEALFAGGDGLDVIRGIVEDAVEHLAPGGLLALELGHGQARAVESMLARAGGYGDIHGVDDYTGRQRVVVARAL